MPTFEWKGTARNGQTQTGVLIADTKDGVYMLVDKSWSIDDLRLNFQFSCEAAWEIKNGKKTRLLRDPHRMSPLDIANRDCGAGV